MRFFSKTKKAEAVAETACPPPYNILQPTDAQAHEIEMRWERGTRVLCRCGEQCTRPTCSKSTIIVEYRPKFNSKRPLPLAPWYATLIIFTRNVPRAMRQGIKWSAKNIIVDGDRIILDNNKYLAPYEEIIGRTTYGGKMNLHRWYPCARRFTLQDTNPDPQWHAALVVRGRKPSVVINFDIGAITQDLTCEALAWDWRGQPVFSTHGGSRRSFNTIFPGLMDWIHPNPENEFWL